MEDLIFKIFIFCMIIIMGVLLLGFFKYLFKYFKLFILNPSWMIKSFSIFPSLCFIGVNYLIILKLLEYNKIELLFAILVGIIGSYFIFKDDEVNNKK
jgi:hypothetical protein